MLPDPIFLNVHMYGVMIAVGLLGAFGVLALYAKHSGMHEKFFDFIFYTTVASIAIGFGSAAFFQALYDYIENPAGGFSFGGGITFIGGLIGGAGFFLVVYVILRKRLKGRLIDILSMAPCAITVAHAFGRVGCFFAGCCYGKPTDSVLGVQFPHLAYKVHPTQLYEAVFLFVLFAVCAALLFKWRFRYNMTVYLIAYGIFRFVLEFWRGDHRGELLSFISPSQFWSILMVVLGVAIIPITKYALKKREAELAAQAEDTQKANEK